MPIKLILLLLIAVVHTGCDSNQQPHVYREIHVSPPNQKTVAPASSSSMAMPDSIPMQKMLNDSVANVSLKWQVPKGWEQKPSTSSMRMATFVSLDQPSIECSIVSLGGMAGGMEANIMRWMKQIQIDATKQNPQAVTQFLSTQQTIQSQGDMVVQIVDLSILQNDSNAPLSMIAAITKQNDQTIFVKMTGSKPGVIANKEKFLILIKSLSLNK